MAGLAADVGRELVPEHVEERDEDRQLRQQRHAGGEGVDFVLFVERHHLLLHALFVVFVLRLDLLDLRLQRLHRAHPFQLFVGERDQQGAGDDRQGDDRHPPAEADVVVEELEDRVGDVDQRLQDVGDGDHGCSLAVVGGGVDRADPRVKRSRHRVEAAVAERIAAQQAPGGEERRRGPRRSARSTPPRRPSRSARSGSGAGGPAEIQRPVGADQRRARRRFTWNALRAPSPARASSRLAVTPAVPSRSISSASSGRATMTKSWRSGRRSARLPERLAQDPLDPVALDRAADLAARRDAEADRASSSSSLRGKL